ncbi:hypothetical protein BP5796_04692 [Coleophoma crateriformis]|uniref:IPT/TIG domain-containing protein n=1 Tax=Coleophoma crateriformis TaxID=565419 RepID=A0A3D8SAM5_9HELO|nr:hypothetical protein BP5796_04692 [Coleophoma crateriformis]
MESAASMSSPPFMLDSDMSRKLDSEPDLEDFFDSSLPPEAVTSPCIFLADDYNADSSHFTSFETPENSIFKSPIPATSFLDTKTNQSLSAPSTASPAGSYQDSASDSSGYKRKSSSDSSRSAVTSGDVMMGDDTDMRDWKLEDMNNGNDQSKFGNHDGTINPASMDKDHTFNDKAMENDFDFESAASSPSPFGFSIDMDSPDMPTLKYDPPRRKSPMPKSRLIRNHSKGNSQHSITQSMNGLTTTASREVSPLSAMVTSQESSPSAFFNNSPSPSTGIEFVNGNMLNGGHAPQPWPGTFDFNTSALMAPHHPPPMMNAPQANGFPILGSPYKPILTIHPTPLKSRVETQIPIKMTLFPLPMGITKLHLPTHTISKPKLLAKPTPDRASDTLELSTMLVCTSAMQNPDHRRRAFAKAALPEAQREAASASPREDDEDDENRPLNGGEVKICPGCITRERKRAARKKVKKVEEEESWHKDEHKRVIVFNTHETKDWQSPTAQAASEATGDRQEPMVPDGAFQVDAPMRIACYCRHQNEKLGFQVIFTIKDYQDRLIAQEITSSIMITDDHKTHNLPALPTQTSNATDGQTIPTLSTETTFDLPSGPVGGMAPFRISHSSSDLQSLQNIQRTFPSPYPPMPTSSSYTSQTTSATMTPRNLSRQASPSASNGPSTKKRKSSGSGKVPTGLAMTKLETSQPTPNPITSAPATGTIPTSATSPFTPNITNFPMPTDQSFGQPLGVLPHIPQQFNTGPPTPNSNDQFFSPPNRSHSMENLAAMQQQMYSAPASSHPSRAPSPNGGLRNNVAAYQQQQVHIAQAVASSFYGMQLALNPQRPPTIHKLIPGEGPKAGGIEVTCLGSGFCQGLEVMFGDAMATTTTFWGETSLVCLLPPAAFAGSVPVTFKHQHHQVQSYPAPPMPKQQAYFKYIDDDEQQIIRTALSVLGHKMTGKMEDVRDLARRIVGDGPSSWSSAASPTGGQNQQLSNFNAASFGVDTEATLLKVLDLIDLDDSPNLPRWNLRRASGQTMLHLACSLGLHRVVAALIARGANPEPRDKGGFTPMHFAALHNHPQIVRRLILGGADPTVRSLQGFTAADMASSEEVYRAARRIEYHSRTRSGSSLRSRTSSATSLRSLWEPELGGSQIDNHSIVSDSEDDDNEYEDEDADAAVDGAFWMRSRRPSAQKGLSRTRTTSPEPKQPLLEVPGHALPSPTAAVAAFRDQLTAQIHHFQQSMHLNLPNLPQMPTFNDYQNYLPTPMVRRISNLAGNTNAAPTEPVKEQESRWWDRFSGTVAPPAYEDIYPQSGIDAKHASAAQAAADAVADNKCAELFDQAESSTSAQKRRGPLEKVTISSKHTLTKEQQDQLRQAHAQAIKKTRNDRNLFFIWIPLLLVVVLATLYYRLPMAWAGALEFLESVRSRNDPGRFVEVA